MCLGYPRKINKRYHFSEEDFKNLHLDGQLWYSNVLDLIYRQSNRSILHVRQAMEAQEMDPTREAWKRSRHPKYDKALNEGTRPISAGELMSWNQEARRCGICMCEHDENERPVSVGLECSDQHIYHTSCLVK